MIRELVFPIIIAVASAIAAVAAPKFVNFDTPAQQSINIQKSKIYIGSSAFVKLLDSNIELERIIDYQKFKWDQVTEKVNGDLPYYLSTQFLPVGFSIFEYRVYNFGEQVIDINIDVATESNLYNLTNKGFKKLAVADGKASIAAAPGDPISIVGLSKQADPQLNFSTDRIAYRIEEIADAGYATRFFGIDPRNNLFLTYASYSIALVVCVSLFARILIEIIKIRSQKFLAFSTPDETYARGIQSLRYLRRRNPKRLRQIIRLYRRMYGDSEESGNSVLSPTAVDANSRANG